jgi:hypothetical protein
MPDTGSKPLGATRVNSTLVPRRAHGLPKLNARTEKSAICRQDTHFGCGVRLSLLRFQPRQLLEISAILRGVFGSSARLRLTSHQEWKADETRADSAQFADVVHEGLLGPRNPSVAQGHEDASVPVTDEIRELEPHRPAFVAGASVLVVVRRVTPALGLKERHDPRKIVQPHGEVEIVVRSCDQPRVEVNGPAAEQPVLESRLLQSVAHLRQRRQLPECQCFHGSHTAEVQVPAGSTR